MVPDHSPKSGSDRGPPATHMAPFCDGKGAYTPNGCKCRRPLIPDKGECLIPDMVVFCRKPPHPPLARQRNCGAERWVDWALGSEARGEEEEGRSDLDLSWRDPIEPGSRGYMGKKVIMGYIRLARPIPQCISPTTTQCETVGTERDDDLLLILTTQATTRPPSLHHRRIQCKMEWM